MRREEIALGIFFGWLMIELARLLLFVLTTLARVIVATVIVG